MKLNRLLAGTFVGVAALGMTFLGAAGAQAAEPVQVTAGAGILSDPPGRCFAEEVGDWKIDKHGVIHYCTYISGEGYYWIPV